MFSKLLLIQAFSMFAAAGVSQNAGLATNVHSQKWLTQVNPGQTGCVACENPNIRIHMGNELMLDHMISIKCHFTMCLAELSLSSPCLVLPKQISLEVDAKPSCQTVAHVRCADRGFALPPFLLTWFLVCGQKI